MQKPVERSRRSGTEAFYPASELGWPPPHPATPPLITLSDAPLPAGESEALALAHSVLSAPASYHLPGLALPPAPPTVTVLQLAPGASARGLSPTFSFAWNTYPQVSTPSFSLTLSKSLLKRHSLVMRSTQPTLFNKDSPTLPRRLQPFVLLDPKH